MNHLESPVPRENAKTLVVCCCSPTQLEYKFKTTDVHRNFSGIPCLRTNMNLSSLVTSKSIPGHGLFPRAEALYEQSKKRTYNLRSHRNSHRRQIRYRPHSNSPTPIYLEAFKLGIFGLEKVRTKKGPVLKALYVNYGKGYKCIVEQDRHAAGGDGRDS